MAATVLVAAAQPLMFNAWTTVAGKWFPRDRRATVVSVLTLASMVGVALGTVLSPALLDAGLSLDQVLMAYGAAAAVAAVAYCVLARDADHSIADAAGARALELTGLKHAMSLRPFRVFLVALFVALGVFNGLSTWALQIVTAIGLPASAAEILLETLLLGGVLGALVLGAASDRTGRRVPWTAIPMIVAAPFMLIFVVPNESMVVLGVGAFVAGFLLTGAMPVGMQYASEIAAPTPEGASSGLFQLCGQASFVVVIFMDAARTGSGGFWIGFAILGVLLAVIGVWMARQPEPLLDVPIPGDLVR
jgi:sugar phosphate permease